MQYIYTIAVPSSDRPFTIGVATSSSNSPTPLLARAYMAISRRALRLVMMSLAWDR